MRLRNWWSFEVIDPAINEFSWKRFLYADIVIVYDRSWINLT